MNQDILSIISEENKSGNQMKILENYLGQISFFNKIFNSLHDNNHSLLQNLFKSLQIEQFNENDIIFKEGDSSNEKMYVIYDGEVQILMKNSVNVFEVENHQNEQQEDNIFSKFGKVKNTLQSGQFFGEKALTEKGGKRNATVIARNSTICLVIVRDAYLSIQHILQNEQSFIINQIKKILPELDKILSHEILDQLAYSFTEQSYFQNETITQQGAFGQSDQIFILIEGQCQIQKTLNLNIKQRNHEFLQKQCNLLKTKTSLYKFQKLDLNSNKNTLKEDVFNQNKKCKLTKKNLRVKLSLSQINDIFGVEVLFEQNQLMKVLDKFPQLKKLENEYQSNLPQLIRKMLRELKQTTDVDKMKSPYIYSVICYSKKVKCLSISRQDFLYKFPIETIEKTKMNFLVKALQRYLQLEYQNEQLIEEIEKKDRLSWLTPRKEEQGSKREQEYLKELQQQLLILLLQNRYSDSLLQKQSIQLPNETESKPYISLPKIISKSPSQFRMPETFDFGNQSIKAVEVNIKSELVNRGLLRKNHSNDYKKFFGERNDQLRQKVENLKMQDLSIEQSLSVKSRNSSFQIVMMSDRSRQVSGIEGSEISNRKLNSFILNLKNKQIMQRKSKVH